MREEDKLTRRDRMRYTKNSLSSALALLAILFNVFFFVSIYKTDVGSYYYKAIIGISIIYNLLYMLCVFLCSEGVKNYNKSYSYVLIIVGAVQIVRMFIIPKAAHSATVILGETETVVMGNAQYARVIIYLLLSAALCIGAGIIGLLKSHALTEHMKSLDGQKAQV
ncbi:MAG: hypothetical protein KBS59_02010 [Clostridiales bacterium]|nr:hypothetical protein [Clostridiales bacterium]